MDEKTRKAVELSIVKWEANLDFAEAGAWDRVQISASSCPLCALYYDIDCKGCPVAERTSKHMCEESPYTRVAYLLGDDPPINEKKLVPAVRAEVEFLKSLLPPENPCASYTEEELNEFRDLVQAGESLHQLERIRSRLDMPRFINRVGKEKCDAMFEVLKKELP